MSKLKNILASEGLITKSAEIGVGGVRKHLTDFFSDIHKIVREEVRHSEAHSVSDLELLSTNGTNFRFDIFVRDIENDDSRIYPDLKVRVQMILDEVDRIKVTVSVISLPSGTSGTELKNFFNFKDPEPRLAHWIFSAFTEVFSMS